MSPTLSADELKELRVLLENAPAGPWKAGTDYGIISGDDEIALVWADDCDYPVDTQALIVRLKNSAHSLIQAAELNAELAGALERISEMTPGAANAGDARALHLTVKAIADEALSKAKGSAGHE